LGKEYRVVESFDPRFIPGRQAHVLCDDGAVGIFGEIHPAVLEAFGIAMPTAGGEFDLDIILGTAGH
ncbi:MAG TPA: phenylalanine--tRNA ligase subunit beta, partial [Rectinemataceae bacterium]